MAQKSKGKPIDVAVKTLKEGASDVNKVKFLQEAAIMGQFSHPNVVKVYGVAIEGEPVSSRSYIPGIIITGNFRGVQLNNLIISSI